VDLAIEGGYVDFGKPDDNVGVDKLEIDANGFDLFGLAGVNLGPVGVFAKLGMVKWDADASVNGQGVGDDDGTDLAYGIGARLKFGSLEARAEYELFDVDDVDDISLLSASIAWTF
jgi:outer membrane immunogenic protein